MNRVFRLCRSALPADLGQLLLLFGVICLSIAPHLRWGPRGLFGKPIVYFIVFGLYAIFFAGTAGFFTCFRPGSHPVRRVVWWVCLPALMGECSLIFSSFAFLVARRASGNVSIRSTAPEVLSELGPGFHYAVAGILLVAVFTTCLAAGSTSLPLALRKSSRLSSSDPAESNRLESFLWVFLALLPLVLWLWFPPVMNVIVGYFVFSRFPSAQGAYVVPLLANAITDAIIVLIAVRMMGREARDALRICFRRPKAEVVGLSVGFPIGITALVAVSEFLVRAMMATPHYRGVFSLFRLSPYVVFSNLAILVWFLPAFVEEIIFRGLLQPLLVDRYGVNRGIFLVGVAFAAAHLGTDFTVGYTDGLVLAKLCLRLISSLALSFVLGWLTLRSESVFPAAIAHGLYNISPFFVPAFNGIGPLIDFFWLVLACALFSYWPIPTHAEPELANSAPLHQAAQAPQ